MPLNKKITDLKKVLNEVKAKLMAEKSIQSILGEAITDELLEQYLDYVIDDIVAVAKEENLDKWDFGRRVLPYLLSHIIGLEEDDITIEQEQDKKERVLN